MIGGFVRRRDFFLAAVAIAVLFLTGAYFLAQKTSKKLEEQKLATGGQPEGSKTKAMLVFEPSFESFTIGERKTYELKLTFSDGAEGEKLDYFKTEINFPKDYLMLPQDAYPDVSFSKFNKIFRVDGPIAANESGKITIELGAEVAGKGPNTVETLTIAKITLQGKTSTPQSENITIGKTQLVNNSSQTLEVIPQDAGFTVGEATGDNL